MPQGLQIFDSAGVLILDATDTLAKLFGGQSIGTSYTGSTASGSIADGRFTQFSGHTPFVAIINGDTWNIGLTPQFSFSGNNLNWSFPHATSRPNTTFIYGVSPT